MPATKKRPPKAGAPTGDRKIFRTDAAPQTTTDAYADLQTAAGAGVWEVLGFPRKHVRVRNTGATNAAHYKILGSIDGIAYDKEIVAQQSLAAVTTAFHPITDAYHSVKVQVKAAVGGSQTTVSAQGVAERA